MFLTNLTQEIGTEDESRKKKPGWVTSGPERWTARRARLSASAGLVGEAGSGVPSPPERKPARWNQNLNWTPAEKLRPTL
jgi:hypothetical protein